MRRIESGRHGARRASAPGRRTAWLVGVLVLALLCWLVAVGTVEGRADALPETAATAFVPPDAYRDTGLLRQGGRESRAMVEYAWVRGRSLSYAVSHQMYRHMAPPPGVDPRHIDGVRWLREALVPVDIEQPARYRVFSITDGGVRLHGQDWGERGLTFEPALLRLPDDAHAGQSWSSHGKALGTANDGVLRYEYTATLKAAEHGCLRLASTTRLSMVAGGGAPATSPWKETDLWCPGRGVVGADGTMGDTGFSVSTESGSRPDPPDDADVARHRPDAVGLENWEHRKLRVFVGDDTFGIKPGAAYPLETPVVTTGGFLAFRASGTTDLVVMWPGNPGKYWVHRWARPGGQILSLTAFGVVLVATTSQRAMMAYDPGGRMLWSVPLDDVANAAPVRVSDDTLAVATLRGTVSLRSAVDGHALWTRHLDAGVARPLASDGSVIAVLDNDGSLHVLDAQTGHHLWDVPTTLTGPDTFRVAGGLVVTGGTGDLIAYDSRTGAVRWQRSDIAGLGGFRIHGERIVAEVVSGLRAFDLADGTPQWSVSGARRPRALGDTWFALTDDRLLALDDTGAVRRSWKISVPAHERRLVLGPGRVWVLGSAADGPELVGESVGPDE